MKKLFIALTLSLSCLSHVTHAQGMEGSPTSTPESQADASRRSAEMYKQIQKENERAREKAIRDARTKAMIDRMTGSTAEVRGKVNYPIVVYDPNQNKTTTKQKTLEVFGKIPPSIKTSSKALAKGVGTNLISLVLYDLIFKGLGRAVDWLLDPDNHRVIIKGDQYYNDGICQKGSDCIITDLNDARAFTTEYLKDKYEVECYYRTYKQENDRITCAYDTVIAGTRTIDYYKDVISPISLDRIADEIHKKADQGNPQAQSFLKDRAEEVLKEDPTIRDNLQVVNDNDTINQGDTINEGDTVNDNDTTNNTNIDNDSNDKQNQFDKQDDKTDSAFEFPDFCEWASWFCSDELENLDDTKVEVQQGELTSDEVNINFGGSCPSGKSFGFNIGGARFTFTLSYEHVCKIAQSMGVLVRILSTIVAVYIIAGIKGG